MIIIGVIFLRVMVLIIGIGVECMWAIIVLLMLRRLFFRRLDLVDGIHWRLILLRVRRLLLTMGLFLSLLLVATRKVLVASII